jgi:biopolymer transport protein ExbD
MRFVAPTDSSQVAVLPLLGVAMVPAVLVLALVCMSIERAEETVRLPTVQARPPVVRESPAITVRLTREGAVTVAGQLVADADKAAAWQREQAALRMLGFEPSQATLIVHADPDVPTGMVQQLIEQAQQAGFRKCALRGAETQP